MTHPAVISLVTLGVRDVPSSTRFYRTMGFELSSASVEGEVSFFRTGGAVLAIWSAGELAADAAASPSSDDAGFRGVALAMNLASRDEVDSVLANAETAGATITKAAQATDWGGYSGYFADADGHAWEVAHNPFWPLDDRGLPQLP